MPRVARRFALTVSVIALGCTATLAQTPAAGPFTQAQVDAGRTAYVANCQSCHQADLSGQQDAIQLAGKGFADGWGTRTTADLFNLIQASMPPTGRGTLGAPTYAALTAFILHANGAQTGTAELTPATNVRIGSIVTGTVSADVAGGIRVAQAGAGAPAGGTPAAGRGGRPGVGPRVPPHITVAGTVSTPYTPVTDAMLLNPPDDEWLMIRRNYAGWSHSPLKQINTQNVNLLQLKWSWAMNEGGTNEQTPLVHDGIMFLGNSQDVVQALDARTGKLIWENVVGPNTGAIGGSANRTLALYGNMVYLAANDAMLYALDIHTGKIVWQADISDGDRARGETGGPVIIKGKVVVGMTNCGPSGQPQPKETHCYISAYDANTGKRDWKFQTVALTGEPGGDTWNNIPDNVRQGTESWIAGTYDPVLNTTYWGTAQAKPWRRDQRGTAAGSTLYSNSTLALDPDSGQLKWYFQHIPGESLDLDEVFERVLIDHGDQKTVMTIGKSGILWKLDRTNGKFLGAKETLLQNVYTKIDPKTGMLTYRPDIVAQKVGQWIPSCPSPEGGHNWMPTSYDPADDLLIIPLSQSCGMILNNGSETFSYMPGTHRNMGKLVAYHTSDMSLAWSFQQRAPFLTGVMSTDGGIAFVGDFDRVFKAVDENTGKILWSVQLGNTVQGHPTTFSLDGKQYVAITTAMGGGSPEQKPRTLLPESHRADTGQQLYVFGLPDSATR